jgi:hypothetical protein
LTIAVSLVTAPTDAETLATFYRKVQPAGFWAPVKNDVLAKDPGFRKQLSFSVEFFNTIIAMIAITALYVSMLYLVLNRLSVGFGLIAVTLACVIILYFTWYKTLPPPSAPPSEEVENLEERLDGLQEAKEAA